MDAIECRAGLLKTKDRVEKIMDILGDGRSVSLENRKMAQELLANLKSDLRKYYESNKSSQAQKVMSAYERDYYFHALAEAYNRLPARSNSRPDAKWIGSLYNACGSIDYVLDQLKG